MVSCLAAINISCGKRIINPVHGDPRHGLFNPVKDGRRVKGIFRIIKTYPCNIGKIERVCAKLEIKVGFCGINQRCVLQEIACHYELPGIRRGFGVISPPEIGYDILPKAVAVNIFLRVVKKPVLVFLADLIAHCIPDLLCNSGIYRVVFCCGICP